MIFTLVAASTAWALIAVAGDAPTVEKQTTRQAGGWLMIGMAKVEITPDVSAVDVRFSGYSDRHRKPATGVLDPVYARALVGVDRQGNLFGIVGLDLCSINTDFRQAVLDRVAPLGFTDQNLMLAATHTHSDMHLDNVFAARLIFGKFDQALLDCTVSLVADAITQAKQNMRPAIIAVASGEVAGMNRSRLDPAFSVDSSSMTGGIQADPEKYPVDERMIVLRFVGVDDKPIGALVRFTAHPTILSPKSMSISADYPGVLCDRVEQVLGPGSIAVFLNGTLGDTAPTPDWREDVNQEIEDMRAYGNSLADRAIEIMAAAEPMAESNVRTSMVWRGLPPARIRPLKGLRVRRSWLVRRRDIPFQAIRIGGLAFIAVPGEPTTAVGRSITSLCDSGLDCIVVAPANGYMGYIVTPEEYDNGTYAADSCLFGRDASAKVREGAAIALSGVR